MNSNYIEIINNLLGSTQRNDYMVAPPLYKPLCLSKEIGTTIEGIVWWPCFA
jgi:hypothetical protein